MLDFLLNKGGAGVSMSRRETVESLDPIIQEHVSLNHAYNHVIEHGRDEGVTERLRALQRKARMDVGKLNETVLSAGSAPYNGTAIEPGEITVPAGAEGLKELLDREEAFSRTLEEALGKDHHIRTKAVLGAVQKNVHERLAYLRDLKRRF